MSIVIPVFNSAAILPALIRRLEPLRGSFPDRFEVVLANDGSTDNSWAIICQSAVEHSWIRGIDLMVNYGQHNALLCGIRAARHDIIVTMDDDLQHPPEEIPLLLARLNDGYDVVYGTPLREQHGVWRNLASRLTKWTLQTAMGAETARGVTAFRAFRARVQDAFASYEGPFVSIDVLLTWGTRRFTSVAVRHDPRPIGKSTYTFRKLLAHSLNMAVGFSTLPLQLASLTGFLFTLFGLGVLVYVIGRYLLQGGSVPGFPFLASALAIFSGAQLFALGIIGEYLARMHFRMMQRPTYIVRSETPVATQPNWDSRTATPCI